MKTGQRRNRPELQQQSDITPEHANVARQQNTHGPALQSVARGERLDSAICLECDSAVGRDPARLEPAQMQSEHSASSATFWPRLDYLDGIAANSRIMCRIHALDD